MLTYVVPKHWRDQDTYETVKLAAEIIYIFTNPGFVPDAAAWLRDRRTRWMSSARRQRDREMFVRAEKIAEYHRAGLVRFTLVNEALKAFALEAESV